MNRPASTGVTVTVDGDASGLPVFASWSVFVPRQDPAQAVNPSSAFLRTSPVLLDGCPEDIVTAGDGQCQLAQLSFQAHAPLVAGVTLASLRDELISRPWDATIGNLEPCLRRRPTMIAFATLPAMLAASVYTPL